jgi:HEAT repeat protein
MKLNIGSLKLLLWGLLLLALPMEVTMANISKELLEALEADESGELDQVIKDARQEDFEALQSLLSLDPSVNPQHRARALYALGRWGDPTPVPAIHNILPHLDETGRISAIDALGRLGTEEALTGVLEHVNDPSPHVRKFVTYALGRMNTPEARAKLKEIETTDPLDFVRERASKILEPGNQK